MPTISNVNLKIDKNKNGTSRVRVTYRICFTSCEALAGSTFHERVTLRGDDPIWDDHIITLRSECVKAVDGCIERNIDRMVSTRTLDEDGDTIIFGLVFGAVDEIYARITLDPFVTSRREADSNIVTGHFGPAGN